VVISFSLLVAALPRQAQCCLFAHYLATKDCVKLRFDWSVILNKVKDLNLNGGLLKRAILRQSDKKTMEAKNK
jgi:hypothetical protein